MNAVEIEEAVSRLAEAPFDPKAFPYAFLEAFGNKETTLKRLKSGNTNQSDVPGGVLQRNNIHLKVCPEGEVTATLAELRQSAATTRQKAKFIFATDGKNFEAENLVDGETVACGYAEFGDKFGFFLPLAGITTVQQIRENAFDIKATGRLNRLYVELLTDYRYSNTLGWNTFPIPTLTEQNKGDLTRCAEDILLTREAQFPATIADLYDPDKMPADLREAHARNDETLERIYIGRRFKNDTERLEKLFELYTQMTAEQGAPKKTARRNKKEDNA